MQVTKGGSFHREGRFSLCNTALLWNFIANLTGYILWKILLDTSLLLLFYVFEVATAKSATQSVLMILTLNWAIPEKFSSFLLYPWTLRILNPPPSPSVCCFPLQCLHCNFWLQPSFWNKHLYPYSLTRIHLLQLKIDVWMEFFWNEKFLFFHNRNFNPKVINYF